MKLTRLPKQLTILTLSLSLLLTPLLTLLLNPIQAQAVENGKIVYLNIDVDGNGASNIYSINPDGSGKTQLTDSDISFGANVSPDGSKIAYLQAEGFFSGESDSADIFTMNLDGTNKSDIDKDVSMEAQTYIYSGLAQWTQNSNKLINPFDVDYSNQVSSMNLDGSGAVSTGISLAEEQYYYRLDYSPDGSKITYSIFDNEAETAIAYIANADGSNPQQINTVNGAMMPRFSPDGSKVYFAGSDNFSDQNTYLYSVSADGTNETQLNQVTTSLENFVFAVISPDGSKIAVPDFDSGNSLLIYYTDGSETLTLDIEAISELDNPHILTPAWSPDSDKLVFSLQSEDHFDLFTINADGSELTNITNTPDEDEVIYYTCQAWAPVPGTLDDEEDSEAGSGSTLTTNLPKTNKASYLVLPSSTSNASFTATQASSVPTDSNGQYSYPTDLVSFQFDTDAGATETITLYFDLPGDPSTYTARKYNDITKEFSSIPNASITREDYNSTNMLKLTYQITDGGTLDQDNTVNGTIVDPVGLATTTGSPDTGIGQYWLLDVKG